MAIIQYTLNGNGTIPSYITDGGYFYRNSDNTLIGIGSGGGTTISKSDLLSRALSLHASSPWTKPNDNGTLAVNKTNDEVTAQINTWCTARGIS